MSIIPEDINADISPTEFELLVKEHLSNLGQNLTTFSAVHNQTLNKIDGNYQIDVYAEFEFLGVSFKILAECKKHKNKIKREVVQLLNDKLRATGSQKGIIFSTSGFQEGAVTYASIHGIALVRVVEGRYTYFTKSFDPQHYSPPPWANIPKHVGEFRNGNSFSYLKIGHYEPLAEFLFKNK